VIVNTLETYAMSDATLRNNVIEELGWRPNIRSEHIGVTAENGVVTLSGHVPTYSEKYSAEQAAKGVAGVRAVVEKLEVRFPGTNATADDEIARRALDSLSWNTLVPANSVQVKVENGWITLSGTVDWQYQKNAAEAGIRTLAGVIGVENSIVLKAKPQASDVKLRIEQALLRNAELDGKSIRVFVNGGAVTLEGTVDSWAARERAEDAAWMAPGVTSVKDQLVIDSDDF
jgi:osmotically-inducible protein OsmY